MKRLLLAFSFLISFSLSYSQGLKNLSYGSETTLEVATWNIEGFPKLGLLTVDSVLQVIRSLDVDLLALQEISSAIAFQRVVDSLDGWEGYRVNDQYSGLAYIYKSSVIAVDTMYEIYPNLSRQFPRAPSVMEMSYLGNPFIVINNHLKCCGDGVINMNDPWDEEKRRLDAAILLKQFIDTNFPNDKVIMLGDLNDILTDSPINNVFQDFISDSSSYSFADAPIASGSNQQWSFPSWPSHLDHILITNEVFADLNKDSSEVKTIRVDDYLAGGFNQYDQIISDHRPVVIKLEVDQIVGTDFDQHISSQIGIYPNPFQASTRITFPPINHPRELHIYNSIGQKVHQLIIPSGESRLVWESNHLSPGIYIVQLYQESGIPLTKRLIRK